MPDGEETIDCRDLITTQGVMDKIYKEAPWKWPFGLSSQQHESLYMVRSASTNEPVGFVGWQELKEEGKKVGYYSVGILPEFRKMGYAKQAVDNLIHLKKASVDFIKALIVEGNNESTALAKSLDINFELMNKKASALKKTLTYLAYGLGTPAAMDVLQHPKDLENGTYLDELRANPIPRATNGALNSILGAAAGRLHLGGENSLGKMIPGSAMKGLTAATTGPIIKDLALNSTGAVQKLPGLLGGIAEGSNNNANATQNLANATKDVANHSGMGAGSLAALTALAGGSLIGGYALYKNYKSQDERAQKGTVNIKLPTRDPNDNETSVQLPFDTDVLSGKTHRGIGVDLRRRLRDEQKERKTELHARQEEQQAKIDAQVDLQNQQKDWQLKKLENKQNTLAGIAKAAASIPSPLPAYDPTLKNDPEAPGASQGLPVSMIQPQAQQGASQQPQEQTGPTPEDMQKKMDEIQNENIDLKIEQRAREIADKHKPIESKAPEQVIPESNNTFAFQRLDKKISKLNQSLGALSKHAATQPPPPLAQPVGGFATPRSLNMGLYNTSNRMVGNTPGIQTPMNLRTVPFGPGLHYIGSMAHRALLPTLPSARVQFMDEQAPQIGWPERLQNLVGGFAQATVMKGLNGNQPIQQ